MSAATLWFESVKVYHESYSDRNPFLQRNSTPCFLCLRCSSDDCVQFRFRWIVSIDKRLLTMRYNCGLRRWRIHGGVDEVYGTEELGEWPLAGSIADFVSCLIR